MLEAYYREIDGSALQHKLDGVIILTLLGLCTLSSDRRIRGQVQLHKINGFNSILLIL